MVITQKKSLRIWSTLKVSWVRRCSRVEAKLRKVFFIIIFYYFINFLNFLLRFNVPVSNFSVISGRSHCCLVISSAFGE